MMNPFLQAFQQQPRRLPGYHDFLLALNAMTVDRFDLEEGNKVLLPASALQQLLHIRQQGPMIFKIQNTYNNKSLYVGVLEFIAEEGTCVVPNWIFETLGIFENCQLQIQMVPRLQKGKVIKLQPHETAFIDLPDPRAVLENSLRNHVCLTKDSTITVQFSGKHYQIDILNLKSTEGTEIVAADINEADVEIDFAPPLDYEEAPPMLKKTSSLKVEDAPKIQQGIPVFQGQGVRIDGKPQTSERKQSNQEPQQQQEAYNPRKHKLNHGVKVQIQNPVFQGQGVKVSNTKPGLQK